MRTILAIVVALLITVSAAVAEEGKMFFMPAYWSYSGGYVPFKDIGGNDLLNHYHTSLDFVMGRGPILVDDGTVWHAYHWQFSTRTPIPFGPARNAVWADIPTTSLIAEKDGYLVLRKDMFGGAINNHYVWQPWKKIAKVNWGINDPIVQQLQELSVTPGDYQDANSPSLYLQMEDVWVIKEELGSLVNDFWDGFSKKWEGSILHVQETEGSAGLCDYWFLKGVGLIRVKATAVDVDPPNVWFEAGAY